MIRDNICDMLGAKCASYSDAITLKIESARWVIKQTKHSAESPLVFDCFCSQCLSHCVCVFCEPLVFTRVVNLHSGLRYTEAPHHGNRAAGGWSAAASHKSTHKPETSVTPNAPTLSTHRHTQLSPSQTRTEQTMVFPQTRLIPLTSVHHRDLLS